jgi:hypothetical protein
MNTPRFNRDWTRTAIPRSTSRRYPKWLRVADLGGLRDSKQSGRKRIFAIVSPPIPLGSGRKTVRHVWIFDNHTRSLRLLSETLAKDDVDLELPRNLRHVVLGIALILTLVIAMSWPLFVR